jgi:hypothetical protein
MMFDAISTLAGKSRPRRSAGGAIPLAAIVVMPLRAQAKKHVALKLGSSATGSDAGQSCCVQSGPPEFS